MALGKFLLKAKDPSLTLRMTVLLRRQKGKEEAIAEKFLMCKKCYAIASSFPPAYTQHSVILSGSEGSPNHF